MKRKLSTSNNKSHNTNATWMLLVACMLCLFAGQTQAQIGTWTPLTNLAPDPNNGGMLLLTDGSVICHTSTGGNLGDGTIWDRLTPDSTGSYVNGTWSQIAPMTQERFSFSAEILKDGRAYAAGGEYGTDGTQAGWHVEIYDPTTNVWTEATGTSAAKTISDGNCKLLDNGDVLQAEVDVSFPVHTMFYNPTTNAMTTAPSTLQGDNESMWLKLPDNSVLFVNEARVTSERYIPAQNQWIADGTLPDSLYDPYGYECGPAWMLPDGRAFFIGGTNHTAFYSPSGSTANGSWAKGPDVPNGYGMPDAPGSMMVNGHILFACSPQPQSANNEFLTPTAFYEFNYLDSTYTSVPVPSNAAANSICQQYSMQDLPNGQVLLALSEDPSAAQYYIYTPGSGPITAGKPVITQVDKLTCTTFMATGHLFNGISEGSAFGDENECDSNYPLFRFTSSTGRVYYARSYNWNSTGVQRGLANDTAYFELPASMGSGSYNMYAVANGIASDPMAFSDSIPTMSSSLTPPSICTGTAFTYAPASAVAGATFTWTRPAVTGISNAAVTTAQTSNPNEVLVNTTGNPITVTYAYVITGYGCNNDVNVTVVVNPVPTAAFTGSPTSTCILPDSVSFTNNSIAGTNFTWTFGDGGTSSAANPSHTYTASGLFDVKLVASSACGIDSITQTGYINVTAPVGPTANDAIHCGDTTFTLTATSASGGVAWFDASGTYLSSANPFVTPLLTQTTTYYVQDSAAGTISTVGPANDATLGANAVYTRTRNHGVVFDALSNFTILSVDVNASTASTKEVQILNSTGTVLYDNTFTLSTGVNTLPINFTVPASTGNEIIAVGATGTSNLYYNNALTGGYPFTLPGMVSLTGSGGNPADYYFFYNWNVQGPPCISARTAVVATIGGCVGINEVSGGIRFGIYPNPAMTELTVDIQDAYTNATLSLKDLLGQTLMSTAVNNAQTTLDLSGYTDGVYLVEVSQGGTTSVRKLVISK